MAREKKLDEVRTGRTCIRCDRAETVEMVGATFALLIDKMQSLVDKLNEKRRDLGYRNAPMSVNSTAASFCREICSCPSCLDVILNDTQAEGWINKMLGFDTADAPGIFQWREITA